MLEMFGWFLPTQANGVSMVSDAEIDRRTFLGTLAVTGGGLLLGACAASGGMTGPTASSNIGLQLYTVRDRMRSDFEGTLAEVAAIGYREVEPHDYFGRTPQQVRQILDRLGLTAPAAHIALTRFREDLPAVLDSAAIVGHRYVVVPSLDAQLRNADGFRTVADELNRYGRAARERGMRVGYHNHDFEFASLPGGGTGMDLLLAGTDPDLVDFELDLYWVLRGGRDPIELFDRHPGRFSLWHVKDMADRAGNQRMADVGTGEVDFRALFDRAGAAGLRHFFVERDDPSDSMASIRTSYTNLWQILS